MPRITDFCSCVYVLGCRLSVVRLCDSDFGITFLDDITIGITCAAFCFHITHISFASYYYCCCCCCGGGGDGGEFNIETCRRNRVNECNE